MMTREEAIALLNEQYETCKRIYDCSADQRKSYPNVPQFMGALDMALTALRPVSQEQLDVVINSLKLRLENNEENGIVSIPKFAVEQMIERLEAIKNG